MALIAPYIHFWYQLVYTIYYMFLGSFFWQVSNTGQKLGVQTMTSEIPVYDLKDLSIKLKISVRALREYIKNGKLRAKKIGKAYYITESNLMAFLEPDAWFLTKLSLMTAMLRWQISFLCVRLWCLDSFFCIWSKGRNFWKGRYRVAVKKVSIFYLNSGQINQFVKVVISFDVDVGEMSSCVGFVWKAFLFLTYSQQENNRQLDICLAPHRALDSF